MNKLLQNGVHRRVVAAIGCFTACASFAGIASGQSSGGPLPNVPGLTDLQLNVANAVQTLCPKLPPPNVNGSGTERLSNSCTLMVVTAAFNQGPTQFPPQFNLRISNAELATGIQAIAPVQANAQKQITLEASRMNVIGARLLDLRGGARGFTVGINGEAPIRTADASAALGRAFDGAIGGGAGDAPLSGRWGGFVNVSYNFGEVDQTALQDAYKYGSFTVLAGADYRVNDSLVLGGAVHYTDTQSDYERSLGNVKARTFGVAGYGTYYRDDWFVDGFVGYGGVDYDATRNIFIASNNPAALPINASATASPSGDQWSASIGVGRNFESGTLTITPSARLGYIRVKNKSFDESEAANGLGLHVEERTLKSLQSALGAKVSTVVNTSYGVFGPYASASWVHEFENDNPSIFARYVNDPTSQQFFIPTPTPTRDYAVLTVGTSATLPNNLSGFFQFAAAVGLNDQTNYGVVLGVRKQF